MVTDDGSAVCPEGLTAYRAVLAVRPVLTALEPWTVARPNAGNVAALARITT